MTRKEFALLSKKARKVELAIILVTTAIAVVVLFSILSLKSGKSPELPLTLLAVSVSLIVFILGQFIAAKALKRMDHVCIACHKPIWSKMAKIFIMTGICPECGEDNFPHT